MKWLAGKKVLVQYALLMGLLLLILEAINYKVLLRQLDLSLYGALIASIFLALGLGLGYSGYQQKNRSGIEIPASVQHDLSDPEMDVIRLMADGHSNREIADLLYVSVNTVKTHVSNIYSKLDVQRRTQAVEKARRMHII